MAFKQGDMFDATEYPSAGEVRKRFKMKKFVSPVPSNDFRVAIAEDIAAGALARLLRTPNEPYTDVPASMAYLSKFRTAKQEAAAYVKGGMNKAPLKAYLKRLV